MDELLRLWARRGARTTPINPGKIIRASTGVYKATGLKRPHIAIAASPLALTFANGAARASRREKIDKTRPSRVAPLGQEVIDRAITLPVHAPQHGPRVTRAN
jgi:hypothetical protein